MIELSLQDVRAGYGAVEVLHDVSLDIPSGALTALLGPNGAGKTTLLSVVAGLLPLRGGRIVWGDHDLTGVAPDARARAGMTLVPERRGIFPALSVQENLDIFTGGGHPVDAALAAFPVLGQRRAQRAGSLSGGEQQMLALARALAVTPKVLIADELSLGLAPLVVDAVFEGLQTACRAGVSVVLIEQFVHRALAQADTAAIMSRGRVTWSGPAAQAGPEVLERYLGSGEEPLADPAAEPR